MGSARPRTYLVQRPGVSLSLEVKVLDSCEIYSVSIKGAPSKAGIYNGSASLNVLKVMLRIFRGSVQIL